MAYSLQEMAEIMILRCRSLINNDLKRILKEEHQPQTGNKAALQSRVIALINKAVANNDADAVRRLEYRTNNHGAAPPPTTSSLNPAAPSFSMTRDSGANPYLSGGASYAQAAASASTPFAARLNPNAPPTLNYSGPPTYFFKESPFFEIRELVLANMTLEASPNHRQNESRNIILNEAICARMREDKSLRLLLFSTIDQPLAPYTRLDVAFPQQIEVRINNAEVKANYKGLKNKPGSTRPADITEFVRLKPANYRNALHITYALTQKKFSLSVYMAKVHSAQDLTQQIIQQRVITKESVLHEMSKKANDPDIEVGSSVMSLKDPISTLRIQTPCRSLICTHNQCFDAESFLLLQQQAPTWNCPICNKTVSFNGLAVDQFVGEILSQAKTVDQVTIEANGEWSTQKEAATPPPSRTKAHDLSDDDLVEIPDYRISAIRDGAALTPKSLGTPPVPSRETSSMPQSTNKRKAEVVDLTLSDDEEPPRPAKKVAYRTPSSLPEPPRYQSHPFPGIGNAPADGPRLPPIHTLAPTHSSRSDRNPPPMTNFSHRVPTPVLGYESSLPYVRYANPPPREYRPGSYHAYGNSP